jgi:hypothetical protein
VYDNAIEVTVAGIDKNKYGILDESTWRSAGSPSFKDILVHLTVEGNANSYTFPTGEEQEAIAPGNITLELDATQNILLDVSNTFAGDDLILDFNAWGWNGSSGNPYNKGYVDSSFTEAVYFDIKEFLFQKKMHPVPEAGKGWKPDFYQGNQNSWDNIHDTLSNNDDDGIYWFEAADCPMNFKIDNEQYKYGEWGWVFSHWEINQVEYPGSIDHQNFNNIDAPLECTPTVLEAFYNPYLEIRATTDTSENPESWIPGLSVANDSDKKFYTSNENGNHRQSMNYNINIKLTPDPVFNNYDYQSSYNPLNENKPLKRYLFDDWAGTYEIDPTVQVPQTPNELPLLMNQPQWPIMQLTDQSLIFVTTNHPSGTEVITVVGSDGFSQEDNHRYWSDTNQPYKFKAVHSTVSQTATGTTHYELEYINVNGTDTEYRYNQSQNECFVPANQSNDFKLNQPVYIEVHYSSKSNGSGNNNFTNPKKRRFIFRP